MMPLSLFLLCVLVLLLFIYFLAIAIFFKKHNKKLKQAGVSPKNTENSQLVVKETPVIPADNQENKTEPKSFWDNLFNRKPAYKQATLY